MAKRSKGSRQMKLYSQEPASGALTSACGRYRYHLWRFWGPEGKRRIVWVMLNPSTADARQDDPTIRRCLAFSKAWGFDDLEVVNLYALRATDPARLLAPRARPIGPENDATLLRVAEGADLILVAWGSHPAARARAPAVLELLKGRPLHCLAVNKDGQPRHPLYCRKDLHPTPFNPPL